MKGKWKVASNPINGEMRYIVYRLRDTSAIDHSGNREYAGEYVKNKAAALLRAEALNNGGETE